MPIVTPEEHRLERIEQRHDELADAVNLVANGLAGHVASCNATGETIVNRIGRLELVVIGAVLAMLTGLGSALWYVLTHSIRLVVGP